MGTCFMFHGFIRRKFPESAGSKTAFFSKHVPVAFTIKPWNIKHVPIAFSNEDRNVKTRSRCKNRGLFAFGGFRNACYWQVLCVSILRGPSRTKRTEIYQEIAILLQSIKPSLKTPSHSLNYKATNCQNPFPFQKVSQWSGKGFWRFVNAVNTEI